MVGRSLGPFSGKPGTLVPSELELLAISVEPDQHSQARV